MWEGHEKQEASRGTERGPTRLQSGGSGTRGAGEGRRGCGRQPVNLSKEPGLQPKGEGSFEGLKQGRDLIQLSLVE